MSFRVKLIDGRQVPDPECIAMLQALYSRSAQSVDEHLVKATAPGASDKFMDRYVVKYGHRSIAQCASTTLFIEGVSLLAAKAIQDTPLYNGQESSTRFIDWSQAEFILPCADYDNYSTLKDGVEQLYDEYRCFYKIAMPQVVDLLKQECPKEDEQDSGSWERTLLARSFDILRGFLPAAACTQLSWATTLDHANERLPWLIMHPMQEIQDIGRSIHSHLAASYPSSFKTWSDYAEIMRNEALDTWYNLGKDIFVPSGDLSAFPTVSIDSSDYNGLARSSSDALELLIDKYRSHNDQYPFIISKKLEADLPMVKMLGFIDFGSFRDLQRHRPGVNVMPLLTPEFEAEPWYLRSLPRHLMSTAIALVENARDMYMELKEISGRAEAQYVLPLCMRVPYVVKWSIPQAMYVSKLRSARTVHPTLRAQVHKWVPKLEEILGVQLRDIDMGPSLLDFKRGDQTIIEKSAE